MAHAFLTDQLASLRRTRGDTIPLDDVAEVVGSLIAGAQGQLSLETAKVGSELRRLLDEIGRARQEISSIQPATMAQRDIPSAQDELDSIVRSTETAAEKIMDAADQLSDLSGEIEGAAGEKVMDLTTQIFEASSFQDLTGQRVTKVVATLKLLEERLAALADAIGDKDVAERDDQVFDERGEVINEDNLTHGPQLEGEAASQADIDALFDSL